MKKILITGAQGFVGKNLTEMFNRDKKYIVFSPKINELDLINESSVDKYFNENDIDIIIHCATVEMVNKTYHEKVCEQNLRMFFNIERSKKKNAKLYSLCSGSIYNRKNWIKKMEEDYFDTYPPEDSHSYSKYVMAKYCKNRDDIAVLRLFGIYGRYEDIYSKFISNSIAKNILKMPIEIYSNSVYDYLYIDDFYEIINLLINKDIYCGIYNITPTESISLGEIAEIINRISEEKSEIIINNNNIINYSGSNKYLLSKIGDFKFKKYEECINNLFNYIKLNVKIDINKMRQDILLSHAKKITEITKFKIDL